MLDVSQSVFLRDIAHKMYIQFTVCSSILKMDDIVKGWNHVAIHAISNIKGQIEALFKSPLSITQCVQGKQSGTVVLISKYSRG